MWNYFALRFCWNLNITRSFSVGFVIFVKIVKINFIFLCLQVIWFWVGQMGRFMKWFCGRALTTRRIRCCPEWDLGWTGGQVWTGFWVPGNRRRIQAVGILLLRLRLVDPLSYSCIRCLLRIGGPDPGRVGPWAGYQLWNRD